MERGALMFAFSRILRSRTLPSPWDSSEPVREELFGEERLAQHARSLAAAQKIAPRSASAGSLVARLKDNARYLVRAYEATVMAAANDEAITPAADHVLTSRPMAFHTRQMTSKRIRAST
jgi:cyclic beta-1,2-glucan synthetase